MAKVSYSVTHGVSKAKKVSNIKEKSNQHDKEIHCCFGYKIQPISKFVSLAIFGNYDWQNKHCFALQIKSTKQSEKKWKGAAGPPIWYAYFELYLYFTKSIVNQMISINIWLLWYHSFYVCVLAGFPFPSLYVFGTTGPSVVDDFLGIVGKKCKKKHSHLRVFPTMILGPNSKT